MMNMAVAGETDFSTQQPGVHENIGYLRATEQRRHEENLARQQQQQQQYASRVGNDLQPEDMSLREVVEQFAQENDVPFVPKAGRMHEGHPVYLFGRVTVALDASKQAVLAHKLGGVWAPVSLEQLLSMHNAAAGGRG